MTEEEGTDEHVKTSKRERFLGALSRTRTKLTKHENKTKQEADDFKLSDDVNDFLAAGRISSSRPSTAGSRDEPRIQEVKVSTVPQPVQQSPRKLVVPRIDVSTSQRWPGAQSLGIHNPSSESNLLAPEYHVRSQSTSSLAKRKGRARGLSVSFADAPPIIIGEGGDEAETPPSEISTAKQRARSLSPPANRAVAVNRAPLSIRLHEQKITQGVATQMASPGQSSRKPLYRTPTGLSDQPDVKSAIEKEFEMSLKPGNSPIDSANSHASTASPIYSPTPVRPPVQVPQILTPQPDQQRRSTILNQDLVMQAEEGMALRTKHFRDLSNSSVLSNIEAPIVALRDGAPSQSQRHEIVPPSTQRNEVPQSGPPTLRHKPLLQNLTNTVEPAKSELIGSPNVPTLQPVAHLSQTSGKPGSQQSSQLFDEAFRDGQIITPDSANSGTPTSAKDRRGIGTSQGKPSGNWL